MWPPRNPPPTKPSRSDRQRPGETAGERRRGRPYGAGVPTLHRPGLCSDKWGASCPDVWSRGPASVAALAGLVPRPPSERCRSWSYEAGPSAVGASARSVLPYMRPPATRRPSRERRPLHNHVIPAKAGMWIHISSATPDLGIFRQESGIPGICGGYCYMPAPAE